MASQSTLTTLDTIIHARCWRFSSSYPKHRTIFLCSAACTNRLKQPSTATWSSVCLSQGIKPSTFWWLYRLLNLLSHMCNVATPKRSFNLSEVNVKCPNFKMFSTSKYLYLQSVLSWSTFIYCKIVLCCHIKLLSCTSSISLTICQLPWLNTQPDSAAQQLLSAKS